MKNHRGHQNPPFCFTAQRAPKAPVPSKPRKDNLIRVLLTLLAAVLLAASTTGSVAAEPPVVKSKKPAKVLRHGKHNHRWHVAMTLKRGLAGTPLAREYWVLEAAGHRWNVSPYLVAGIAGTESSFGAAACQGNAWGIASCGVRFSSFAQGARYTTRLLARDYDLSSLYTIAVRYCPPTAAQWAVNTRAHMGRFGADGNWLRYPG